MTKYLLSIKRAYQFRFLLRHLNAPPADVVTSARLRAVGADARRAREAASVEDKHPGEAWACSRDSTERRGNYRHTEPFTQRGTACLRHTVCSCRGPSLNSSLKAALGLLASLAELSCRLPAALFWSMSSDAGILFRETRLEDVHLPHRVIRVLPLLNSSLPVNVNWGKEVGLISWLKLPPLEKQILQGSVVVIFVLSATKGIWPVPFYRTSGYFRSWSCAAVGFYCGWNPEPSRPVTTMIHLGPHRFACRTAVSFVPICSLDKRAEFRA